MLYKISQNKKVINVKLTLITLSLLVSFSANAGLLDSFKDPATLILNQKSCFYGRAAGEIVDGKFIVQNIKVIAILKKLDKNRITLENQILEPKTSIVLNISVKDNQVEGALTNGQPFIGCKLD